MNPRSVVIYDEIAAPEPRFVPKDPPLQWPWAEARAQVLDLYTAMFSNGLVEWHGLWVTRRELALLETMEA